MKIKHSLLPFILTVFIFTLTACQTPSSFNFGAYSEAERLYEKKKYKEAVTKYEEYLRENPEGNMSVISTYYLAKSHEALAQFDQAKALYEKIVREHPDLTWANFARERLVELSSQEAKSSS